ncbi:MAG TPA: hypothetical protein VN692_12365, partial [Steroidobacteraceae bacterium]|nr:hypothetical protein [Steroidobacteraceae bacterium]
SAAEHSGLVLDFSKLAKQAKIDRKACARFYEVLEDTLIASRLEVFDRLESFRDYYKDVDGFFLVTADGTSTRRIGRVLIVSLSSFLQEVGL